MVGRGWYPQGDREGREGGKGGHGREGGKVHGQTLLSSGYRTELWHDLLECCSNTICHGFQDSLQEVALLIGGR